MNSPSQSLTIVVCTYNNAGALALTLEHLDNQTAKITKTWDVLVVANNCTDHTANVLTECADRGRISRFRWVDEAQQGLGFARRRAVAESPSSDWIAWIDDDNFVASDWVACALDFIDTHPRCGVWGGKVEMLWETPPSPIIQECAAAYAKVSLGDTARKLEGEGRWELKGAGLVTRRDALVSTGWQDWQACVGRLGGVTMAGDDLEIVMRIARSGWEVWWEPACVLHHAISRQRINFPYLRKLFYGFGLAQIILLGLKENRTFAGHLIAACRYYLGQTFRTIRHFLIGIVRPLRFQRGLLEWDYLRASVLALKQLPKMSRQDRNAWLRGPANQDSHHSPEALAASRTAGRA